MSHFVSTLEKEFESKYNVKVALEQKAYLRNQFETYGIKTTERREITNPFLIKSDLPSKNYLPDIIKELWGKPHRDFHYFGQELFLKYIKQLEKEDIHLIEFMISHNSWWDTVDFIAVKLVGTYFKKFPEERNSIVKLWLESEDMWLQRSALLFQLKYKEDLDPVYLSFVIKTLLGSKEFFINKAIGWVLREYSRTNSQWVIDFVNNNEISSISRKEALRLIR